MIAVSALAAVTLGGWGVLDKLLSSAVPSRASTVACPPATGTCTSVPREIVYVTKPGDTIWAIAVRFSDGGDPRPLEYRLEQQIGGGTLQPGQVLRLPPPG
jgi:LysM domain